MLKLLNFAYIKLLFIFTAAVVMHHRILMSICSSI